MARQLLRLLGTRYGTAVALLLIIAVVVGVARAVGGSTEPTIISPPVASTLSSSVGASASADAALGDDSVATPEEPAIASVVPGAPPPDAAALSFARAWVKTAGLTSEQWLKQLVPYSTRSLLDRMQGVDPTEVPATGVGGEPQVRVRDAELVEVNIAVTPGLLRLRLILSGGRWLVDSVAWDRP